ncbi:MAG: ABC transporter permease [Maricaulaceae bacterium]
MEARSARAAPSVRALGAVNTLGLWTLYRKEVGRFLKVSFQTVLAPMVSTLLFVIVFKLAIGANRTAPGGGDFTSFLAPGLVMMALLTNAFANSASSILIAKVQGNAVDFLMPPLSPFELTAGFVAGAATRGIIVALAASVAASVLTDMTPSQIWAVLYFSLTGAVLFGALGVLGGVAAFKFDHLAAVQNFVLLPLTFLSGTFYSSSAVPEAFRVLIHLNPVFYLIDGFRYGFTGRADGDLAIGAGLIGALTAIAVFACRSAFARGWRLKA